MNGLKVSEGKKVSEKRRDLILINIILSTIVSSMMATALTTALPPIMKDLNIDVNTGQWLTSGFSLFLAIMTPLTAYLITRFKTKKLYIISLLLFMAGLTICACSVNFWMMMAGRIIQGSGNGLIGSMSQVIILTIFPPKKIGVAMGWFGFAFTAAPVIAPTLAGVLVDTIGWRMIFIFTTSIMALSLIASIFVFENVLTTMKRDFDIISLIISAFAFGGITLAIGNMGKHDFVSYQVLLPLIIGIITSIIFVFRQLKLKLPFLDIRVLKDKKLAVSTLSIFLLQLVLLGNSIIFPIYIQQIKENSATISGLSVLPGSIVSAILSPVVGKLYDKIGIKLLFIVGPILFIISSLTMYFLSYDANIWISAGINVVRCIGIVIVMMPLVTWGMSDIPKTRTSDATALTNSFRSIGSALGSALFVSIMTKVARYVEGKKEHPDMYGFNVAYLIMAFLGIIVLILGIFGCKNEGNTKRGKKEEKKSELNSSSTSNESIDYVKEEEEEEEEEIEIKIKENTKEEEEILKKNFSSRKEDPDSVTIVNNKDKSFIEKQNYKISEIGTIVHSNYDKESLIEKKSFKDNIDLNNNHNSNNNINIIKSSSVDIDNKKSIRKNKKKKNKQEKEYENINKIK